VTNCRNHPDAAMGNTPTQPEHDLAAGPVAIELCRVVTTGRRAEQPGLAGLVMGTWNPDGPGAPAAAGCLAVVPHRAWPLHAWSRLGTGFRLSPGTRPLTAAR
jgi:hypothetical protein